MGTIATQGIVSLSLSLEFEKQVSATRHAPAAHASMRTSTSAPPPGAYTTVQLPSSGMLRAPLCCLSREAVGWAGGLDQARCPGVLMSQLTR